MESFEELSKSHFQRVEVLSCVDRLRKNVPQLSGFERERVLINGANGGGGGNFLLGEALSPLLQDDQIGIDHDHDTLEFYPWSMVKKFDHDH